MTLSSVLILIVIFSAGGAALALIGLVKESKSRNIASHVGAHPYSDNPFDDPPDLKGSGYQPEQDKRHSHRSTPSAAE